MSTIDYHPGPPKERIPFLASALRGLGSVLLLVALLAIPAGMNRGFSMLWPIGVAVGCLVFSVLCLGLAKIIALLAKFESNTQTEEALGQEVKLLREIAKHTDSPANAPAADHR